MVQEFMTALNDRERSHSNVLPAKPRTVPAPMNEAILANHANEITDTSANAAVINSR